ncbi:hypothetical protein [Alteromonas sp. C1M14]|uniref:hypothetical protein n=1 Tax=Alteromonas sp. C1M14 TaxID=2841567 RepID=UPI001C07F955|nr:hypothetical protein [Alteromonas sp. C1M14]MBU2979024.1 hypothetical protein [Alteromonas sp. C1M14]
MDATHAANIINNTGARMIHYISKKSGRHVELEPVVVHIRTPGEPLPRDFTASATIVDGVANISLGASHSTGANPHEVKTAIQEALESIGVRSFKFRRAKQKKAGK